MGIFRKVIGQDAADQMLSRSLESGRLAHAYLFAGPQGTGRLTATLELAASWMCREEQQGYCGECRDCVRIFSFGHPDVRVTVPMPGNTEPDELATLFETRVKDGITPLTFGGNASISIHQVREMEQRLARKSYEGGGHMEIFTSAHRMGVEASNALLKTLEEPPADTVIVLVSSSWTVLLPTIRSRSHLVRFRRLPSETVASIVTESTGITPDLAMRLALASDGSPGTALIAAASEVSPDPEGSPAEVLKLICGMNSSSDVLSEAVALANKLKRDGAMTLVTGMRSCVHDLRRVSMGLLPLSVDPEQLRGIEVPDDAAEKALGIFDTASVRLKGNGMARVVLSAALLGVWKLVSGGRAPGEGCAH